MDKSLYLNWAGFMHTGKFLKGKFSCSYHPGRPLICQEFHSFRTSYSHLRAGMKVKLRKFFFKRENTPISWTITASRPAL